MDAPFVQNFLKIRLGERYQLRQRIASGTFGEVYIGRDVDSGEEVAVKLEHCSTKFPRLQYEVDVYETLQGHYGFPQVLWHGSLCDYNAMVFELLGPSLEDVFRFCGNQFSLKTVLMLMDQLLCRLEHLHLAGYVHRDIKPENFLLGTGKRGNAVYIIDFGLVTCWRSEHITQRSPPHRADQVRLSLVGTRYFASINGHYGTGSSPRDDLESLGYMALYFLRGSLPWQSLRASSRGEKDRLVLEQKRAIAVADLCADLPAEFGTYMNYVRALNSWDLPDHKLLRSQFDRLFRKTGFEHDRVFDWTIREFEKQERGLIQ